MLTDARQLALASGANQGKMSISHREIGNGVTYLFRIIRLVALYLIVQLMLRLQDLLFNTKG